MPLDHAGIESLFRLGKFNRILEGLRADSNGERLRPEDSVVVADTLLRSGDAEAAQRLAEAARPHVAGSTLARCEMVLGLVAREHGNLPEALDRLRTSVRLASADKDFVQAGLSAMMRMISRPPMTRSTCCTMSPASG